MLTASQDPMVFTEADFDRLPGDGMFEVVRLPQGSSFRM